MAFVRRSRFPVMSRSQRRQTSWSSGPRGTAGPFSASNTVAMFTLGSQALADGLTLVRIRGEFNFFLSTISASLDGFLDVALGIANVTENAFGIGTTAVPDPRVDIGWDGWIYHYTGSIFGPSATVDNSLGPAAIRLQIDSKAMRKIKSTDVLIGVAAVGVEVGTAVLQCHLETRILDKVA